MRKALGKRVRFDVFKRDAFKCQYCGAHPPSVVLQVDHIKPVALGGENDIDNLITSCQPCNIGKGARELSSVPQSLTSKADLLREQREQLAGYERIIAASRKKLIGQSTRIAGLYELLTDGMTVSEKDMISIRLFISKLGFDVVFSAMERALTSNRVRSSQAFKYFCGICWGKIREASE